MGDWLLITAGTIILGATIALVLGLRREQTNFDRLRESLVGSASASPTGRIDFGSFSEIPPPVARYFRTVLAEDQKLITRAQMRQSGMLRTSTTTEKWVAFTADQLVVPTAPGFVWNAKVRMPFGLYVRVLDSYVAGVGAGHVSLLSAIPVASQAGEPELSSGALHRYLAEAVWCPTALLPQTGVLWSPIDEHSAMATLSDRGISVSLEFRFNEAGEVSGIYTPGRFGSFQGEYKQVPWEGHFRDYQLRAGMRIPLYGEVGWYDHGVLELVWKGSLLDARYEFGP